MQKLIIKNFGPVKDVNLDINDFMVFIGPQASGKSTISKALYFFRLIRTEFAAFFDEKFVQNELSEENILDGQQLKAKIGSLFLNIFPVSNNHSNKAFLSFEYQPGISITLIGGPGIVGIMDVSFSDGFGSRYTQLVTNATNILKQATITKADANQVASKDIRVLQIREARNLIIASSYELFKDSRLLTFIPAGRGSYSISSGRINISTNNINDFLAREFAVEIDYLRKQLFSSYSTDEFLGETAKHSRIIQRARNLLSQILKGSFSSKDGLDSIGTNDGVNILLQYASSGQQESVWILLVIIERVYYSMQSQLFIEEPEAHLFPESQKLIIDLIALFANNADNKVVITTHSPYILAAINNLLYALVIGKKNEQAVSEIIDPLLWLDYKRLGVYFVENGTIRSILDEDLKMIKNEEIDAPASSIINSEYDKISNIAYQNEL